MSVRDRIKRMEQMAMQEKEGAPDERGRSPGGVSMASNTSASGSPRPLSKVRTSFVAIADKEGRIGLARQPSGDSSFSERKLSGDTDAASSSILLDSSRSNVLSSSPDAIRSERTRGPSGSFSRPGIQNPGAEPTCAAPATASPSSGPVSTPAGPIADPKASSPATSSGPVPGAAGTIAGPKATGATTTTESVSSSSLASGWGQKGLAASPQIREAPRSEQAAGQRPGVGKSGQSVQESEAQLAHNQSQAQAKGSENALDHAGDKDRASGGPGGASGSSVTGSTTLNGKDKAKTTKPAPKSSTQPKPAGKVPESKGMTTPVAERKPTEKKATPSNASPPFVKPRPKSPTQPVKLPERLTTHTGASAAKSKNAAPPARPASRTSTATSGKKLGRSASAVGRKPHASFGPPPKQAVDHPVLKKESKVDEGFLARMMRPTQAYANKVADKAPKTPPRATATTKKPASGKTGPTKKAVPKSTTTSAAASPETVKSEQSLAVKQIPKREDPIMEEPINAKKVDKKDIMMKDSKKEDQAKVPQNALGKEAMPKDDDESNKTSSKAGVPEPTPKKASDAILEAFMNPGRMEAADPQANGNHTKPDKANGSSGILEAGGESLQSDTSNALDATQPSTQSASSLPSTGLHTAPVEQEEW